MSSVCIYMYSVCVYIYIYIYTQIIFITIFSTQLLFLILFGNLFQKYTTLYEQKYPLGL